MMLREIATIVILVSILIGVSAHYFSKKNDSPLEQLAEEVLETQGVDIDFSAADKKTEESPKIPK